ncbi:hypothetical protein N7528_009789 [Penicillium herquei]|nr:hypothetical protein N7528_009789 [Penicillium herquei]
MTDFYDDVPSTYVDVPLTREDEEIDSLAIGDEGDINRRLRLSSSLDSGYLGLGGFKPIELSSRNEKSEMSVRHTGTHESIKRDLFQGMLKVAIAAAYQFPTGMRSDWIRILSERSLDQWVRDISDITLYRLKLLLIHSNEPSFQALEALDFFDTNLMGVYLSSIKQKDGLGKKYLYIGSASSERGLLHRINQHRNAIYSMREA